MQTKQEPELSHIQRGADFLEHFGIKGMRWGVRRREGPGGQATNTPHLHNPGLSEDARKAKEAHSIVKTHRSTDPLSNKDLQHLVNRLNLEQRYSKLTEETKSSKGRATIKVLKNGQSFIREGLGVVTMGAQIHSLAKSPMMKDIQKAINSRKPKTASQIIDRSLGRK